MRAIRNPGPGQTRERRIIERPSLKIRTKGPPGPFKKRFKKPGIFEKRTNFGSLFYPDLSLFQIVNSWGICARNFLVDK